MGKREQLLEIMEDAAKGETKATLRARIVALEAQLAERVKVSDWDLEKTADAIARELATIKGGRIHGDIYNAAYAGALAALQSAALTFSALEATPPAPKVTEVGPVPTYECEFRVGQPVRLANPYAEDDPDLTFYVTGIDWEYRSVVGHGWNITVATAEEIARGYGATDGFTPSDLTAAQDAGKP